MKRLLLIIALLSSLCVSAQIDKVVPGKPAATAGLVHDFAGILTPEQEHLLESKLIAYNDSTSNQVVIVTLLTLADPTSGVVYEDEEVALKILREWGVGQKDRNNGIVILIVKSKDDKERKIRIEVGYGLEGAIPDITAKSIIDHEIVPNFKERNYYRGLNDAVDAIISAAAGEYTAPKGYGKKKGKGIGAGIIFFILIMIFLFGGRRGGRGGGMASRRGFGDIGTGMLLGSLLGGGHGRGGGGWSGGGGGGFGGFGGGFGGGGGASGSW